VFVFNILLLTAGNARLGNPVLRELCAVAPGAGFRLYCFRYGGLSVAHYCLNGYCKFDRVRAYQWTIITFVIFGALIFFLPPSQVWLIFGLNIIFSFIQNLTTPLQWTMFSDVVDYEEHRSGRRLDGLVFSTALFAIKFGLALGGVVGWVLGMVDYAPGQAVQAPHVLSTINALFTLIPCALFIGMVALLTIYKLNSRLVDTIARELASKRQARPDEEALSPALHHVIRSKT
jgi:Na+/melibiose symporter-like transporter